MIECKHLSRRGRSWSRSATGDLAHRDGEHRLRVRAELLRDGGPDLAAMMDELRELHLGVPRPDADVPRPSELLRAAYEAAISDGASGHSAGTRP